MPECTEVYNGKRYTTGNEGAKAYILGIRQTFSDLHIALNDKSPKVNEWPRASSHDELIRVYGLESKQPIDLLFLLV